MSGKGEKIEHEGKVIDISQEYVSVEILNKSACAECHARSACGASDQQIKVVEIPLDIKILSRDLKVGDTVNVVLSPILGVKAIWFAYVIPLIILLATIFVLSMLHLPELAIGLSSLGAVGTYLVVLSFFRKKLSRIFVFSIE